MKCHYYENSKAYNFLQDFLNKLKDKDIGFVWTGLSFNEDKGKWLWLNDPKHLGHR